MLDTAIEAVRLATRCSLKYFRRGVKVEVKPDRSPVTQADQEAEAAILKLLAERHPSHAVLGEETGAHTGSSEYRWIIDPLDGTRGFSRGGTFWGPLVALEKSGQIIAGAMALPALGELYYAAKGEGCWLQPIDAQGQDAGARTRMQVSSVRDWSEATLSLGELQRMLSGPIKEGVAQAASSAAQARCYGDLAACVMLFSGRAEAWIETGVKTWDLAPLKILVEEAGGRFTDLHGEPTVESGHALGTNGVFHDMLLPLLTKAAKTV